MVWKTLFEVVRRWLDYVVTLTILAFVICVAMLCGAGLVPTLVEADSIRRDACSCYAECNNVDTKEWGVRQ